MIAEFEILDGLPTTGPMYIPISRNNNQYCSQGYTVKFFKDDESEWVANFEPGFTDFNGVFSFDDNCDILVIAGGTCYYMNPNEYKPISIFGGQYERLFKSSDGRLIIVDLIVITVFEPSGIYWHSSRISLDGFRDLELCDNVVSGLSFSPECGGGSWERFSYDIDTKTLIGG